MIGSKVYRDTVGLEILLHVGMDISECNEARIYYYTPSGKYGSWASERSGDTMVRYMTEENDLNEVGVWGIQAKIIFNDRILYSDVVTFTVYETIPNKGGLS